MKPIYTLIYFDIRGLAEQIRLLLIDNRIPFDEIRIKSDDEWSKIKESFVFGQLPCLKDDDVKIVQSGAIMRHLARRHDLYGRNEMERTFADMFYEGIRDIHQRYIQFIYYEYICFADYALFEVLDVLLILSPTCLTQCSKLKAFHHRFNQRPSLQNYLMKRASNNVRVNWNGKE
uniref:GST N-terminal domain-containing protein n=1 Tax=Ascaris lumbricoides TaxID=6252 RepID=A0A0M3IA45_ASCLU